MDILFTIIHLLACFVLVIVVLLQKGKGADLAGAFGGGGSAQALGVRSTTQFIHKLTIAAAVFFMLSSWTLGFLYSSTNSLAEGIQRAGEAQNEAVATEEKTDENKDAAAAEETKEVETPEAAATEAEKPAEEVKPEADENK